MIIYSLSLSVSLLSTHCRDNYFYTLILFLITKTFSLYRFATSKLQGWYLHLGFKPFAIALQYQFGLIWSPRATIGAQTITNTVLILIVYWAPKPYSNCLTPLYCSWQDDEVSLQRLCHRGLHHRVL